MLNGRHFWSAHAFTSPCFVNTVTRNFRWYISVGVFLNTPLNSSSVFSPLGSLITLLDYFPLSMSWCKYLKKQNVTSDEEKSSWQVSKSFSKSVRHNQKITYTYIQFPRLGIEFSIWFLLHVWYGFKVSNIMVKETSHLQLQEKIVSSSVHSLLAYSHPYLLSFLRYYPRSLC